MSQPWNVPVTSSFNPSPGEDPEKAAERLHWCEMVARARQALPNFQTALNHFNRGPFQGLISARFFRGDDRAALFEPRPGVTQEECQEALKFTNWFARLAIKHGHKEGGMCAFLAQYAESWKWAESQRKAVNDA